MAQKQKLAVTSGGHYKTKFKMNNHKVYFPNLNGLRFFAAFLVIINHTEQLKSISKLENYFRNPFVGVAGYLGVVLFFVLSGFLITYLLLKEEESFQKISMRKFYIRRALRIWPLYYFMMLLAFLVLPNIDLFVLKDTGKDIIYKDLNLKLLLYGFFLSNLVLPLLGSVPYISHTWSIGTEEQYYLVWPAILKYFRKHRIRLMFIIIVFYVAFRFFLRFHYSDFIPHKKIIIAFWNTFNIDCMAIGGLFAILLFQKNKFNKLIQNNILFYSTLILTIFLISKGCYIPHFHSEFYAILFGIIIINFAANDTIAISLENKALNYLGNISYGIYMYHPIAIVLTLYICTTTNIVTNWIIYPMAVVITIILAGLSYKYFESFFLKFKDKFSIVKSGNRSL